MRPPKQFVELCTEWHSGQGSMMYAIASTGRLSRGTIRPESDMTDDEWDNYLFDALVAEIRHCLRVCKHGERALLNEFLEWAEKEKTVC